jgi:AraC-like DNA-binding protein
MALDGLVPGRLASNKRNLRSARRSSEEQWMNPSPSRPRQSATQRFSTASFAPQERVAAWREHYGRTIAKLDFEQMPDSSFNVDATLRDLPDLGIASLSTLGLRFRKPGSLIDADDLIVVIVESGTYSGRQLGREVKLGPGEAVVRMNAEVTTGEILGRLSIVRVPTSTIAPLVGDIAAAVQQRIPANAQALQLLRPYLSVMCDCDAPRIQMLAARHVQDLVAMLLGATRDATQTVRNRSVPAARLHLVKEDIARNLEHGDLSLAAVAARHRMSARSLQKLFEPEGKTFSEHVLDARLARAHRLLADPCRAGEKIATVAFAAGFGDVSYFYRAFRRRYGVLPSDVRSQAGAP